MINEHMTSLRSFLGRAEIPSDVGCLTEIVTLSKKSKYQDLEGSDVITRALVWQWLESLLDVQDVTSLAKKVNCHLQNRTYIVCDKFTLVDVVLFYILSNMMKDSSTYEQQTQLNHLARWFDHMQHKEEILVGREVQLFVKNRIY
uniref:Eukaryotic translation elongation factor 1 epsilon-1-like n=1 Tax=Ciona intestinalis TaxID=7719 RepID=F6TNV5_CIOIN|nr:eukaryotic translation elongation factor 1 epsilon-1-like [Ciona intestinalis]|eukprot:XP_002131132.1 eukaryotic translation elongation factor 1 epsilon-1-like [Ciona intestinalis]